MAYNFNNPYAVYPYNIGQQMQQPYNQTQPVIMAPQQQQQNMYQQPSPSITARSVAGREEAVASQVLPDGNMCVFVDIAHNMIYTKQINPNTMECYFNDYQKLMPMDRQAVANQVQQPTQPRVPTYEEFSALRHDVDDLMSVVTAASQPQKTESENKTERR